jgi:hypothetical protein
MCQPGSPQTRESRHELSARDGYRAYERGNSVRIRRWTRAAVAGSVVIAGSCVAVAAASTPAMALVVSAAICNTVKIDNDVMCLVANDPGSQIFTVPNPDGNGYHISTGGQFKDLNTGLCLKDDPNEGNAVVELACTGSGTTGLEETWISYSYGDTDFYYDNAYADDNGIASAYLHMAPDGYVNCYKYGEGGFLWYTPS